MFRKKTQPEQQSKEEGYQVKPAPSLPANLARANTTTWPQQWEHKWLQLTIAQAADPSKFLALMGIEGWELVAVYPSQVPLFGAVREFYFKRPKMPDPPQEPK